MEIRNLLSQNNQTFYENFIYYKNLESYSVIIQLHVVGIRDLMCSKPCTTENYEMYMKH